MILDNLAAAGTAPIIGGWEYVIAAYAITWLGLTLYGVYLFTREKGEVPADPESNS